MLRFARYTRKDALTFYYCSNRLYSNQVDLLHDEDSSFATDSLREYIDEIKLSDFKKESSVKSKKKLKLKAVNTSFTQDPNSFEGVHTKYGWFVVPKNYCRSPDCLESLQQRLKDKLDQLGVSNPDSNLIYQLQNEVVENWYKNLDLDKINKESAKNAKNSNPKARNQEVSDLRILQLDHASLKLEIAKRIHEYVKSISPSNSPDMAYASWENNTAQSESTASSVSEVSAWNYFCYEQSMQQQQNAKEGENTLEHLSNKWKSFGDVEKQQYQEKYTQLLKQGKDIINGKLVELERKPVKPQAEALEDQVQTLLKELKLSEAKKLYVMIHLSRFVPNDPNTTKQKLLETNWKTLDKDEKQLYLIEYAKLRALGYDLYRNKIISQSSRDLRRANRQKTCNLSKENRIFYSQIRNSEEVTSAQKVKK